MAWTPELREKYISEVMAGMNELGYEVIKQRDETFWAAFNRMKEEYDGLLKEYPDRWVAVGIDGLLAIGDSAHEVTQEVEDQGYSEWEFVIEFLESDPVPLVL